MRKNISIIEVNTFISSDSVTNLGVWEQKPNKTN